MYLDRMIEGVEDLAQKGKESACLLYTSDAADDRYVV